MDVFKALSKSFKQDLEYNLEGKNKFHNAARRALHKIAKDLGLKEDDYEIRSNKGGIAVSGEITLHADNLYIQISKIVDLQILYRSCKGRKDYCGGPNHFMSVNMLSTDYQEALSSFSSVML